MKDIVEGFLKFQNNVFPKGRVTLHGWVYDIESGRIDAFDGDTGAFVSLGNNPAVNAVAR